MIKKAELNKVKSNPSSRPIGFPGWLYPVTNSTLPDSQTALTAESVKLKPDPDELTAKAILKIKPSNICSVVLFKHRMASSVASLTFARCPNTAFSDG